jgi:zinc protease
MTHSRPGIHNAESAANLSLPGPHDVTRHQLSNGLTVLVRENHTSPTAVLRGYVKAGGVCDTDPTAGLAGMTATTARRGTETRTFQEINEAVESLGASLDMGAGRQLAGFSGQCLSEDLPLLIEVTADVLQHPSFPATELEKVRGQVITSLCQLEDNTQRKANREFRTLCYPAGHPFGRSTEGTMETVPNLQRDDLLSFYERFYSPRGTVIIVVGDVTTDDVVRRLEDAFVGWQASGDDRPYDIPPAPRPTGAQRIVVPMFNKTQADIVWGVPALPRASADYYAARVANAILGQVGLMGRLGANVRDRQGLAYYASSSLGAGLGPDPWSVFAGVAPESVDRAVESILAEIARLRDELVAEEELADAQDYLTGILPLRLETNDGVAGALIEIELYELGLDYLTRYPGLIRAVTREDVQAVAQKYLDIENYALAIAGPYGEPDGV